MTPSAIRTTGKMVLCCLLLISFPGLEAASQKQQRGLKKIDKSGEQPPPEWSYRRTTNDGREPYSVSEWKIGYPDCGGDSQSPINLSANIGTFVEVTEFNLDFFGAECSMDDLQFEANGQFWRIDFSECPDASHLSFDGGQYTLLQMHIHSPSDHTTGGSVHDAELHLVHSRTDPDGLESELLVVGILLDTNAYGRNLVLEPLWAVLGNGVTTFDGGVNPYDLLPNNLAYSHYMGSLTNPPCTEIVRWVVMNVPGVIGRLQMDIYRDSVSTDPESQVGERSDTDRLAQPLNGRVVFMV